MKLTIEILDNNCKLSGDIPLDIVKEISSYRVKDYKFSPAFRKGYWDGYVHLYNKKTNLLPIGLLNSLLDKVNYDVGIIDKNNLEDFYNKVEEKTTTFDVNGIDFGQGIYSYQLEAANTALIARKGIIKASCGAGKTEIFSSIIKKIDEPTIVIVPGLELLYQTQKRIATRLNKKLVHIGIIGDSEYTIGKLVTVACPGSLINRLKDKDFIKLATTFWKVLIIDEADHSGADTWYDVINAIKSPYRFGCSATPLYRSDGGNLRLIAQTGEIIYEIKTKTLVDLGVLAKPYLEFIKIDNPKLQKQLGWHDVHSQGITKNKTLNNAVIAKAIEFTNKKLRTVIIVQNIYHGEYIEKELLKLDLCAKFISGTTSDSEERKQTLLDFDNNKIQVLVGSNILSVGYDSPHVEALILNDSGKSKIMAIQRIGRALRKKPGKDKAYIVDFDNYCHKFLEKHSKERLAIYKEEDCYNITYA